MKLGLQMHSGAKFQERTMKLVTKPRKIVMSVPRCLKGTYKGVSAANWCTEWICRMQGGLGPHTPIISAALSLLPMRGTAAGRAPTILQIDLFYTRISNFVQSPILATTSIRQRVEKSHSEWLSTNILMCCKYVSQKRNESIDKNHWYNIVFSF